MQLKFLDLIGAPEKLLAKYDQNDCTSRLFKIYLDLSVKMALWVGYSALLYLIALIRITST